MSTAQPSTTNGFERAVTSAWRSVRRVLPGPVAEAIRKPARRVLHKLHLIRRA
jgi:hypothetical protein